MSRPVSKAKQEAILRRLSGYGSRVGASEPSAKFKKQLKQLSRMSHMPGTAPLPYGRIPHDKTTFHDQKVDTRGVRDLRESSRKRAFEKDMRKIKRRKR